MADILYTGEFTDDAGNNCKVDIHKVGYNGSSSALVMGSVPVTIKTIGQGDKFEHIITTEAYIEVISSVFMQYIDLFTLNQKTFYVKLYRGTSLIWAGWINPEYYTEPFVTYPHTITIHAVDGLAELKNVLLPMPEVIAYNFKQTAIYYIISCLNQVGIISPNRNIRAAIDLVATKYDDTNIFSRILESIYIDFRALQDEDGKMLSCYDVLNEILSALNARIYQHDFHWTIERPYYKYKDYFVEYYSIGLGTYIGSSTENELMPLTANLGWGSTRRFLHAANLELTPAAKRFTIQQTYNTRSNLLRGNSYKLFQESDFESGILKYWTYYTGAIEHCRDAEIEDCLRIKGTYLSVLNALDCVVELEDEGVDNIDILFKAWKAGRVSLVLAFDVSKRFANKDSSETFNASVQLFGHFSGNNYRLKDKATTSFTILGQSSQRARVGLFAKTNYDGSEGTFEPAAGLDNITIDLAGKDDFVSVNYKVNAPPDEELNNLQTYLHFTVRLIPCVTNLLESQVGDSDGLLYKNMRLFFQENFTETYERDLITEVSSDNILEPEEYKVKFGNTPDNANCNSWGALHKTVFFDNNNKILRKWGYTGDTMPVADLTESIIMTDLYTTYRRPGIILNGNLLNTTLGIDNNGMLLNKILQDYDNRYYIPTDISYNMRSLEFESKWLCIRDESGTGEFNDDFSDDFFT